jgi:hypothetical protein
MDKDAMTFIVRTKSMNKGHSRKAQKEQLKNRTFGQPKHRGVVAQFVLGLVLRMWVMMMMIVIAIG